MYLMHYPLHHPMHALLAYLSEFPSNDEQPEH